MTNFNQTKNLFNFSKKLDFSDAVCALLILENKKYFMQLRDDKPGIFYPGHWGLFGGGVEYGEEPEEAINRELMEEIGLKNKQLNYFMRADYDFTNIGDRPRYRIFFEINISKEDINTFNLTEGMEMRAFTASELLTSFPVVPYDAFAIWLHHMKKNESAHQNIEVNK